MEFVKNFPLFSIILAILCAVVTSVLKKRAARRLSFLLVGTMIAMNAAVLIYTCTLNEAVIYKMGHFSAPWGNEIRFYILEPLIMLVFSGVLLLCLMGGKKHLLEDIEDSKLNIYYVMIDLIALALTALVYTNDIFTGYVFIEICTISSCGILMIRQIGRTTMAAMRYMIFSLLGSGLFLLGVILLYDITGHLLMQNICSEVAILYATGEYRIPLLVTISLMSVGIAIKSGLFPFHFWMPDTYGYSTPCSAGILSGLISKAYIFLLIKIIYRVIGTNVYYASGAQYILYAFGIAGMIFGSISAIRENNINRMVAYSSAAQIGYIYMGIGMSATAGVVAAVFHIIFHALTKPALFLSSAMLEDVSEGSKRFFDLQGAAYRNRTAGMLFAVCSLSMVGLPLFMGFVSKLLFASAAVSSGNLMLITLIALAISTILNTIYFLRTVIRIFTPASINCDIRVRIRQQTEFFITALVFIAANIYFGLHSQPIVDLISKGLTIF